MTEFDDDDTFGDNTRTALSAEFVEIFETMVSLIGEEGAWRICELFQGEQVTFPKSILRFRRNREIRQQYKAGGMTYRDLACQYGLTSRQIRHIVHVGDKSDKNYCQLELL